MIAVSVKERAATDSKVENVGTATPVTGNTLVSATVVSVPSGERQAMIAQAAYYIAERRGFELGHELEDWLCAEREINSK